MPCPARSATETGADDKYKVRRAYLMPQITDTRLVTGDTALAEKTTCSVYEDLCKYAKYRSTRTSGT